jgi:hypothetical protein
MFPQNTGRLSRDYTALYPRITELFITTDVRTSNPTKTSPV